MIIRGVISNKSEPNNVRLVIPSQENNVSYNLEVAHHIKFEDINIGDTVVAAFYTKTDGVVIAICQ